ncbi:glucose PTS transporter subunit IIA [Williamsoniiplasma luminosum]|uniref:PTS system, beta-glucoside-specific IIABC component n=1 Tax=Williamsoniiplasma luminosum TaxID=214888 RepID=A0A2S0NKQ4_9MOLU|nr:glucose PTS transporter subunit IIA [Williamsoniiplasma luminosum]AVP49598.1 MAG: hypothetical protein C5T88_03425 [Williamsoniiplasma luminosum]
MNENKKIIIYSPIDGIVKPISELNDGVFSEGMLGEGCFIEPTTDVFFSPFKKCKLLQIFETKHAYFLESEGAKILIHIGLDTVSLNGKPFQTFVKENDELRLETPIVKINRDMIKKHNLNLATPIVMDLNESKGWTFNLLKAGFVKQGEKIAELIYDEKFIKPTIKPKSIFKFNLKESMANGIFIKNRDEEIASRIYNAIGTKSNYEKYYNCVTRLRFIIKDKSLIKEEEIKKIDIVKGLKWNGAEFQVIIGGEVEKIKDGLDRYLISLSKPKEFILNHKTERQNFSKSLLNLIKGIIMPAIPALIGVGLLNAIAAILQQARLIENVSPSSNFASYTLATQLVYLIAGGATLFMGIFFTYNAVKYFGGNPILGLTMGLILTAPIIFKGVLNVGPTGVISASPWSYTLLSSKIDGINYVWMKIGPQPGSIITSTLVGYILVKAEFFGKKRFPNWSQMMTTPTFALLIASVSAFFIVGPVISVLEATIGFIFSYVNKMPSWLSIGIFATIFQPLVITGAHGPLLTILQIPMLNDPDPYIQGIKTLQLFAAIPISHLAQAGASIGLYFIVKNKNLKQMITAGIPVALLGITEPLIFGANLPKTKAFVFACVGAGVGGLIAGIMGVQFYAGVKAGMGGWFSLLSANGPLHDTKSLIAMLVGFILAMSTSSILVLIFQKDRVSERIGILKANTLLSKFMKNQNLDSTAQVNEKIENLKNIYDKNLIKKIKLYEKQESIIQEKVNKIKHLNDKETERSEKLAKKFNLYNEKIKIEKNNNLIHKLESILKKLNTPKYEDRILILEDFIYKAKQSNLSMSNEVKQITQSNEDLVKEILDIFAKNQNKELVNKIYNRYFNAINSVFINLGEKEKLVSKFNKQEKLLFKHN